MTSRSSITTEDTVSSETSEAPGESSAALAAATSTVAPQRGFNFRRNEIWTYFGPAFVASVAYIDPGNFATNIEGGSRSAIGCCGCCCGRTQWRS